MREPPVCKALILDMDGLLLDTESTYALAWRRAAEEQGHYFGDAFWASLAGLHYQDVEARIGGHCGNIDFTLFRSRGSLYWHSHVHAHGIALQSGFEALFEALAATTLPYCLATNSRAANADECLRLAGVAHLFPTRLTRDHVEEGKPAPEIFLKAAALLGAGIGECWAAEDSYPGILAAKRAGAFAICIPPPGNADPRAADMADLVLHDLAELAEIIDKRFTSAECHRV